MRFAAVRGCGGPNEAGGAYQQALSMPYAVCYTLKMGKRGSHRMEGYFDYVVPPLEAPWWQEGTGTAGLAHKGAFCWIPMVRLPGSVREEGFRWAQAEAARKKGIDCARVGFFAYDEGGCVQCMHIGAYDEGRPRWRPCAPSRKATAGSLASARRAATTRYASAARAAYPRKSARRSCACRCGARGKGRLPRTACRHWQTLPTLQGAANAPTAKQP